MPRLLRVREPFEKESLAASRVVVWPVAWFPPRMTPALTRESREKKRITRATMRRSTRAAKALRIILARDFLGGFEGVGDGEGVSVVVVMSGSLSKWPRKTR